MGNWGANDYSDIINLPHPELKHPRMSMKERAAIFSPFAALSGHKEAVMESERVTEDKIILDENKKEELDAAWAMIQLQSEEEKEVSITYFVKDPSKSGGAYRTAIGKVKKLLLMERKICLEPEIWISIDDIINLEYSN